MKNSLKSILLMSSLILTSNLTSANAGENKALNKTKILIEASTSENALIIKSTTECNVKIIDECGQAILEQKVEKGTSEVNLKNIKSAKYKIVISDGVFSIIRKLSIK